MNDLLILSVADILWLHTEVDNYYSSLIIHVTGSLFSMPDNALIVNNDAEYLWTSYYDQEVS